MARSDQQHFRVYTDQNRIKHIILGKYLSAYLNALKGAAPAFHYIDGFAGCGLYEEKHLGSPLLALEALGKQTRPFSVSFVEQDERLFDGLSSEIEKRSSVNNLLDSPLLRRGEFHQFVGEILSRPIYSKYRQAATFAFVDPCGVQGVHMEDIARILRKPYGECLLFWNYDGINRWLGGVAKGEHDRAGLVDLFGDDASVECALKYFEPTGRSPEKERGIVQLFIRALRSHRAYFVVPFRVEARDRDRTSHYLIHCSCHNLAFKIMKEVMGAVHTGTETGAFEFSTAAETLSLFQPIEAEARERILHKVRTSPCRVSVFSKHWVSQPEDPFTAADYKRILLELEAQGLIAVMDKQCSSPMPRDARPKAAQGKPTLGDDYYLQAR